MLAVVPSALQRVLQSPLPASREKALPLGYQALDEALPGAGLPRGAVVEIASPRGLARATSIALMACASAQAEARLRGVHGTEGAAGSR